MRKLLHLTCLVALGCTSKVTSTGYDPLQQGTNGTGVGPATGTVTTGSATDAGMGVTGTTNSGSVVGGTTGGQGTTASITSASGGDGTTGLASTTGGADASVTTGGADASVTTGGFGGAASNTGDESTSTDTTSTTGQMFGGNNNTTSTNSTTGGAGGTTSAGETSSTTGGEPSEECRVMVNGDVPVCCTPLGDDKAQVDEVFELLNAYRNSLGLDSLANDSVLEETMQGHCKHMSEANFFSHNSIVAELDTPWDRADICGTNANAENIAQGYRTPADVMTGWQNSSGHDQNMRTTNSSRVGIGFYDSYWGQIFGP